MLSAIISARESERSLVPTLNALFPAVMTGLLAEVIVADAGSKDATPEVADMAGCIFQSSEAPLGQRLKSAVAASRGAWLLFLPAGSVPDARWVDVVQTFTSGDRNGRAGVFRTDVRGLPGLFRAFLGGRKPEHGLLIARRTYDEIGGHDAGADADRALLRKLSRRIDILPASVNVRHDT